MLSKLKYLILISFCIPLFLIKVHAVQCDYYIDKLPYIISKPGVYCLKKDIVINSSKFTVVPAGYFSVKAGIYIKSRNVILDCQNHKITVFGNPKVYDVVIAGRYLTNVIIRNCIVNGKDIHSIIYIWPCNNITISNIKVKINSSHGDIIELYKSKIVKIENIIVENSKFDLAGILLWQSNRVFINNVKFINIKSRNAGFGLYHSSFITINNVIFSNSRPNKGVLSIDTSFLKIENLKFINTTIYEGISLFGNSYVTINKIDFLESKIYGQIVYLDISELIDATGAIHIRKCLNIKINNINLNNSEIRRYGIYMYNATKIFINHSKLCGAGHYDIYISSGSDNIYIYNSYFDTVNNVSKISEAKNNHPCEKKFIIKVISPKNNSKIKGSKVEIIINSTSELKYCNVTIDKKVYNLWVKVPEQKYTLKTILTLNYGKHKMFVICVNKNDKKASYGPIYFILVPEKCDYVIDHLPYEITHSGIYCVTKDLVSNSNGIVIKGSNLNVIIYGLGYKIRNSYAGGGYGISIDNTHNSTIKIIGLKIEFDNAGISIASSSFNKIYVIDSIIHSISNHGIEVLLGLENIIYVNNSNLCSHGYDIYVNSSFGITFYIWNSYFDEVFPGEKIIENYPDHNYYCNGILRNASNAIKRNYTLKIRVIFHNKPLSNVTISIDGKTFKTNKDGYIIINLPEGKHKITAYDTELFTLERWSNGVKYKKSIIINVTRDQELIAYYKGKSQVFIDPSNCKYLNDIISEGNHIIYLKPGIYNYSVCGDVKIENVRNIVIIGLEAAKVIIQTLNSKYKCAWYIKNSKNIIIQEQTIKVPKENSIIIENSDVKIFNTKIVKSKFGIIELGDKSHIVLKYVKISNCEVGLNLSYAELYNVEAKENIINLMISGESKIVDSKFCGASKYDIFFTESGYAKIYNSYFDIVNNLSKIQNYPDHNYYCNNTPRGNISKSKFKIKIIEPKNNSIIRSKLVKIILTSSAPLKLCKIQIDNSMLSVANLSGKFKFEYQVLLEEGKHKLNVTCENIYNDIAFYGPVHFEVKVNVSQNVSKPKFKINIVSPKGKIKGKEIEIIINSTSILKDCEVHIGDDNYTFKDINKSVLDVMLTLEDYGEYYLYVTCKDIYNRTAKDSTKFKTIPPICDDIITFHTRGLNYDTLLVNILSPGKYCLVEYVNVTLPNSSLINDYLLINIKSDNVGIYIIKNDSIKQSLHINAENVNNITINGLGHYIVAKIYANNITNLKLSNLIIINEKADSNIELHSIKYLKLENVTLFNTIAQKAVLFDNVNNSKIINLKLISVNSSDDGICIYHSKNIELENVSIINSSAYSGTSTPNNLIEIDCLSENIKLRNVKIINPVSFTSIINIMANSSYIILNNIKIKGKVKAPYILFVDSSKHKYIYVNNSYLCGAKVYDIYLDHSIYITNSYFDTVNDVSKIINYPDHNYYCDGTPRMSSHERNNRTNVTKFTPLTPLINVWKPIFYFLKFLTL